MSGNVSAETTKPIPASEQKMGLWGTLFLWTAASLVTPSLMTGQMFIPDIAPLTAIVIVVCASLVGTVALSAMAIIGTRTRLPTFVVARATFGTSGAKLFAVMNIIILAGWGIIQGYLGGLALHKFLLATTGIDNVVAAIIITQGLVMIITLMGHTGIQKVETVASILMLVLVLSVIYKLLAEHGYTELQNLPLSDTPSLTYAIVFDLVLASAFSWMALPCDYNRYCRSVNVSAWGIGCGYLLGTVIAMTLGILVGSFTLLAGQPSSYDPAELLSGNYAVIASAVLFVSVLSTNLFNLYSMSMSALSLGKSVRFVYVTLGFGLFCLAGSLLQELVMAGFFDWILFVGAAMIPSFAIILTDYYWVKKSTWSATAQQANGAFNVPAIITYIIGAVFSLYFTYVTPLAFGATALTFLVTALTYPVLIRLWHQLRSTQRNATEETPL
ncbi:purine-cytosine permease family protein [Alteromonas lipolytica]|uniref:Cytosine permease n=1 Tax=Alteromonas lipolytica TaxID=1856405 RepID=A0A1E8FHU2_9ALTE|nr:cytosine permease [Alteromonas lipolytica]OFI35474.1 hypothetical protein BFC17_11955 [Alteromonas lipolytica]GGF76561.1 cytosine permease [Alteromonas lipolytica]